MSNITIFQYLGDLSHVLSFVALFYRLYTSKSAAGISLKTQELYLLVFATRYSDLILQPHHWSLYTFVLKVLYLGLTGYLVYLIRFKQPWAATYEHEKDTFQIWKFAVPPCIVLGLIFNHASWGHHTVMHNIYQMFRAFSYFLEAIAIWPQLIVTRRHGVVENITSHYIAALGAYRGFYILNWIDKLIFTPGYSDKLAWFTGIAQTALFADFFYYYFQSKFYGNVHVRLPK